jgi:hypothetical protein
MEGQLSTSLHYNKKIDNKKNILWFGGSGGDTMYCVLYFKFHKKNFTDINSASPNFAYIIIYYYHEDHLGSCFTPQCLPINNVG